MCVCVCVCVCVVFYPFSQSCLLVGAFNPFTFKVIIGVCEAIASFFMVVGLFL